MKNDIKIIQIDSSFVVCIKPEGLLSQQSDICDNMPDRLIEFFKERGEETQIFTVHRLDRETCGIMVYARTEDAAAELSRQIGCGLMKKRYQAIINGCPQNNKGVFEDLLFHDSRRNKTYVVKRMRKGVRRASLEYEVIASENGKTLVEILLHTGRTHQIRVQFASRKMPLEGDGRYGGGGGKLGLLAYKLEFEHPITHKKLEFETEGLAFGGCNADS